MVDLIRVDCLNGTRLSSAQPILLLHALVILLRRGFELGLDKGKVHILGAYLNCSSRTLHFEVDYLRQFHHLNCISQIQFQGH